MLIVARPLNHNNEGGKAAARDRALISDGSALSYGVFWCCRQCASWVFESFCLPRLRCVVLLRSSSWRNGSVFCLDCDTSRGLCLPVNMFSMNTIILFFGFAPVYTPCCDADSVREMNDLIFDVAEVSLNVRCSVSSSIMCQGV